VTVTIGTVTSVSATSIRTECNDGYLGAKKF